MTKISIYALIVLGFSAFLSSCQIEKQYHSNGFKISGPQWGISANKGPSSNRSAISPDQNQQNNSTNKTKTPNLNYSQLIGSKETDIATNNKHEYSNAKPSKTDDFLNLFSVTIPQNTITNKKNTPTNNRFFWDEFSSTKFQENRNSETLTENGNSLNLSTNSFRSFFINPQPIFPPDTIIIYDTIFEENALIIPDSTMAKYDAMILKSQELKEKSLLPIIGGYVVIILGSIGVFFSAIIATISLGEAIGAALIILGVSLIVLLLGGISVGNGMKMESESRILAKKAKALLEPYEGKKPPKKPMKKSSKKLILAILGAYLVLQIGLGILTAL